VSALDDLRDRFSTIVALGHAGGKLRWDQQTVMPPGGTPARSNEAAAISSARHDLLTRDSTGRLIDEAAKDADTRQERALVREARRAHERSNRVPDELVDQISRATSNAHTSWVEAKHASDFAAFSDDLDRIVELKREYAHAIDPDRDPYAVLFEDYEPYLGLDTALDVIDELAQGVHELLDDAPAPQKADALEGPWPVDTQRELVHEIVETMGYDFEHGRLDDAEHPFTMGNAYDVRITTHLYEDDLLSGLTSTVHEAGHAIYTQNLPREHFSTPIGEDRDLVVHESQARLWENHVGRSQAFWSYQAPKLKARFDREIDPEAAWRAANRIEPSLIRVDADEITYHLHVKLRTELEQRLVHEGLGVDELPQAWNDRMDELLGVRPDSDAEGVLQDVHWSHGSIGYFPTYSLGSVLAAQLADAFETQQGSLDELVREGHFEPLRTWLTENIHQHGAIPETGSLIEQATGNELSADAFLNYARAKTRRLAT